MRKKYYRFFGGLLLTQENWLNKMSASGYRLTNATKAMYEFEKCDAGQYQYKVEYIGQKSKQSADDYVHFLEDCGYQVFFKNINLNYSVGKIIVRPWAEKGGRIASNATTFNRELLIVEKKNDGKPFELHTTYADQKKYYQAMRKPWLFLFIVSAILGIIMHSCVWAILGLISLIGIIIFQIELSKLKKEEQLQEW